MSIPPVQEDTEKPPILVVDKAGLFGSKLAELLAKKHLVVLVTGRLDSAEKENIITVPFVKRVPRIPDNKYSQIFIIDDQSRETRNSLNGYINKSQFDKVALFFVTDIRKLDGRILSEINASPQRVKLILLGDLFGRDKIYDDVSVISRFHESAKKKGGVLVEGTGLNHSLPVFDEDVLDFLVKQTEETGSSKKILYLFPNREITDLSLARMIKKIYPPISIDFVKGGNPRKYFIPEGGDFVMGDYKVEDKIRKLNLDELGGKIEKKKIIRQGVRLYSYKTFWIIFMIFFLLSLPLLTALFYSFLGIYSLNSAKNSLEKGNLVSAHKDAKRGLTFFNVAEKSSRLMVSEASIVGINGQSRRLNNEVRLGKEVSSAAVYFIEASEKLKAIYVGKSQDPGSEFKEATNLLKNSISVFRKIEADKNLNSEFSREIKSLEPLLEMLVSTSEVLPDLLGFEDEKTYLLLFQNNMELRPGGGFIGSYGILKMKKGRVEDFKINDVYSADGQLKAHVEPPYPIRRYLPSANWYMRDSNFDPDFPTSARSAAYLLNLETGVRVDGVIAVDVSFVKEVLKSIGTVEVSDYKQKVSANNFYTLTQKHAEENFFPGSTQKKDFLSSLYKSIQLSLSGKKNKSYFSLSQAVSKALTGKHILFALNDSRAQEAFSIGGWSSALIDNRVNESGVYNDYVAINEANLGVNKANFSVKRRVYHDVLIDDGDAVAASLEIIYDNDGKSDYKNYLRAIVPFGAVLKDIKLDGKRQEISPAVTNPGIYEKSGFIPPQGLEVEDYEQYDKRVFGFLVNVPKGKKRIVTITYTLPKAQFKNGKLDYSMSYFKQPGTEEYPFTLNLKFPSGVAIVSTQGRREEDRVVYSDRISSDFTFLSSFARR